MRVEVTKRDLEVALAVAKVGTSGTGSDITTHYVFRHTSSGTNVLSSNGRLGVGSPLICKVTFSDEEKEGAFTVEAKRLDQWLNAVEDAVLNLELEKDKKVRAKSPGGSIRLNSLDPSNFPYWDDQYEETGRGYAAQADRLRSGLSHVKQYVYDKDSKRPEISVVEIKESEGERILSATDQKALGRVKIADLQSSASFRIHAKDLSNVLGFLQTAKEEPIEIREHEARTFFVRGDRAMLNVPKPRHSFPDIPISSSDAYPYSWTLDRSKFKDALLALSAGAPGDSERVNFSWGSDEVVMKMPSATGSENNYKVSLKASEKSEEDFPEKGFDLPLSYLKNLLIQFKDPSLTIELKPTITDAGTLKGGQCRFRETRFDDVYSVILPWSL